MKEQFDDNYINIEDAAQYLGIKPVTLRNWIKKEDNNLPAHKVGKQWKFKRCIFHLNSVPSPTGRHAVPA